MAGAPLGPGPCAGQPLVPPAVLPGSRVSHRLVQNLHFLNAQLGAGAPTPPSCTPPRARAEVVGTEPPGLPTPPPGGSPALPKGCDRAAGAGQCYSITSPPGQHCWDEASATPEGSVLSPLPSAGGSTQCTATPGPVLSPRSLRHQDSEQSNGSHQPHPSSRLLPALAGRQVHGAGGHALFPLSPEPALARPRAPMWPHCPRTPQTPENCCSRAAAPAARATAPSDPSRQRQAHPCATHPGPPLGASPPPHGSPLAKPTPVSPHGPFSPRKGFWG